MAELAVLSIHERDITPELCQRCARCCRIEIKIPNTDSRYRRFLRQVGFTVVPTVAPESTGDCCDAVHEITLDIGPCRHLVTEQDERGDRYACSLYGRPERPQLCEEYNCVSWAKATNTYEVANDTIRHAQKTWRQFDDATRPSH